MTRLFTAGSSDSTNRSAVNRTNPGRGLQQRHETGLPVRQNALNPGFHGVASRPENPQLRNLACRDIRTYTGTISGRGAVSGAWSEGGTGHSTGTWSLGSKANRACPRFWWWNPRHECFVRSH